MTDSIVTRKAKELLLDALDSKVDDLREALFVERHAVECPVAALTEAERHGLECGICNHRYHPNEQLDLHEVIFDLAWLALQYHGRADLDLPGLRDVLEDQHSWILYGRRHRENVERYGWEYRIPVERPRLQLAIQGTHEAVSSRAPQP